MTACSRLLALALLTSGLLLASCDERDRKAEEAWKQYAAKVLPQLGHRNWLVVADSAYPSQSHPGIVNVQAGGDQLKVVEALFEMIDKHKHLRPIVHLDEELEFVADRDARGIGRHRNALKRLIGRRQTRTAPHEALLKHLESAASRFNVVVFKTDTNLPYTTMFIELDCGYWGADAENRLRDAMKKPREKD
jgi:hypothetical protein